MSLIDYDRCPRCRKLTGVVLGKFRSHLDTAGQLCTTSGDPVPAEGEVVA